MATPPLRLLVVCTANICRSVMAEYLLRHEADVRGLELEVSSCGLRRDGDPPSPDVVEVMGERGLDVGAHRSRRFRPELLDGVDLVVTMERFHARELALASEGVAGRILTLGAAAAWFEAHPVSDASVSAAGRVAELVAARTPGDVLGVGPDEVADPHGRSRRIHRQARDRIESLCHGLIDGLYDATSA